MSKQQAAQSSFDSQIAMGQPASKQVDQHNVASGSSLNGGNTVIPSHGAGLSSAIGGQSQLDTMLHSSKLPGFEGSSMDNMIHIEGAMAAGVFDAADGAMSPFKLATGPALEPIQGEAPKLEHTAFVEQSGAKIQGATGIISQSQGQGH